jgi:EmrB/QacA subfamily drug resistance transporter
MAEISTRAKAAPPAASPATGEAPSRRRWAVLSVLAAVAFMAQLDLFIVNVALPAMSRSYGHPALNDLSWVLNAYSIAFAALLVPMGRLADHFGRKRFLLSGVAVFTIGSLICAVAPNLLLAVGGRAVQAIGASMVVPTSLGLLYPSFPKHEHSKVVGIWAGVAAVAAAAGPTVGGMLAQVSWRLIFLINLPIGIATIIAGLRILPEVRAHKSARLPDPFSGIVLVATLSLLTFATVQSSTWGWSDSRTVVMLAVALAFGIITVWRTVTHPHALIEAGLFRTRQFTTATIALFLFFLGFAAWLLLNVLLFEDQWHWSVIRTGLALVPGPLMAAVFAINAGRIAGRIGRTIPAIIGPLLFTAGTAFWLVAATAQPDYWGGFLPGMIIAGSGAGLTQAPLFAAASTLAADRATTGSAVLNMARQVGSAIGVAILVTILASAHGFSGYQHGFVFIIITTGAAAVTSAISAISGRRGRVADGS